MCYPAGMLISLSLARKFNDEDRLRATAYSVKPVNFAEESRNLLGDIKKYLSA